MSRILIIGGSRGIGKEVLNYQLDKNKRCVVLSRSGLDINDTNIEHHKVDISNESLPEVKDIESLVFCPGSITLKPFLQLKDEDFLRDFEINVIGAIKCIRYYINELKNSKNPSITMFSTVAVGQGMPFHSSISTAKAGVEGLTKSLAAEFAPNVRVNCIAPTLTKTDLAKGILRNERIEENISEKHPLKKICEASDVSGMVNFLVSRDAKMVTGQIMRVDSGMSTLKI